MTKTSERTVAGISLVAVACLIVEMKIESSGVWIQGFKVLFVTYSFIQNIISSQM